MQGHAACPECEAQVDFSVTGHTGSVSCTQCGKELVLAEINRETLTLCPICEEDDFYRVTQLNPQIGLLMVASCFLGFLACVYFIPDLKGFLLGASILLTGAVLDRILRIVLPEVVICYHCKSVYTDVPNLDNFEAHDQEKRAEIEYGD